MKKIVYIAMFFFIILCNLNYVEASSSVTYFSGEAVKIENENIEIISEEINIDTINSKINNTLLLKNIGNEEEKFLIEIPLENREISTNIHNLVVKINGVDVKYSRNSSGDAVVRTKAEANIGKKIEIEYYTDNDLKNAKVIKYNFDNFQDREIGYVKMNIVIDEKDIPLVEKIYPGHYNFDFDTNTISVEYYNFKANTITKNIIIEKETFENLLYRREDLHENEINFISDYKENGINAIIPESYWSISNDEDEYIETSNIYKNIYLYINLKRNIHFPEASETYPLLYDLFNSKDYFSVGEKNELKLKNKTICIEYVETEQEKELYKEENGEYDFTEETESVRTYEKVKEEDVLKSKLEDFYLSGNEGAKIIFINEGINGENLGATNDEIYDYINSVNADFYLRIELYSGEIDKIVEKYTIDGKEYESISYDIYEGKVGYYNDELKETALKFIEDNRDDKNKILIKLDNEEISNNIQIPTLVQFKGYVVEKDDKYVVDFLATGLYNGYYRGLITISNALETEQAQKMIKENKAENGKIKFEIENKISNLNILDNETEIQNEITKEKTNENSENLTIKFEKNDYIVLGSILFGIIILILILISKKNK